MPSSADERGGRQGGVIPAILMALIVVGSAFGILAVSLTPAQSPAIRLATQAAFTVSLSFSPNPVSAGTQTQISLQFTGGNTPFTVWVNGSAPGCGPQQQPFTTSNYSNNFSCTPTSSGTYNVHIDAFDSSRTQGSTASTLTVNTGSGGCTTNCGGNNGSSSGNGSGSGGFSLPAGLVTTLFTFALVFFAGLFALAAGVIAMAVLISRRLRQLTEAMKPREPAPPESKPPT